MSDYLQPNFYRFNQDSLKLVRMVLDEVRNADHLADLGSGCGIIGIELANALRPKKLTLLELQESFKASLEYNVATFLRSEVGADILQCSFGEWKSQVKPDLIVCNPPYFLPGRGEPSEQRERHLCRSFDHENWRILFNSIKENLAPHGSAYLVIRNDQIVCEEIRLISRQEKMPLKIDQQGKLCFLNISGIE